MKTTTKPARPSLPADVTRLGRGRGQRAALAALHVLGPAAWRSLSEDIARHPLARGVHFSALMSACDALVKRGLVLHQVGDRGDMYQLIAHTHT
jgi:hypothetical protein